MPKRLLDDSEAGESSIHPSPAKRFHSSATTTPARSQASSDFLFSTPYTPYSCSIPSDSPTNPFGRHRHLLPLALPKATSFGKHMALRFQVARSPDLDKPRSKPRSTRGRKRKPPARRRVSESEDDTQEQAYDAQGTYRIVQVPRSYTFRHLRALILFLFGGDPDPSAHKRRESGDPGHLFELQRSVVMYTYGYKPGQVKTGKTWAKLSSIQDPLCAESFVDLAERADGSATWLGDNEEGEEWTWENEEDFTIGHAWPDGGELRRAIVYHHDAHTTVHITVNTQPVPRRKGVGNKPFVFRAFGEIKMDAWYTPPPPRTYGATKKVLGAHIRQRSTRKQKPAGEEENLDDTAEADEAGDDTEADEEEEEEEEEEDWDGGLDTRTWNWGDAFVHFLERASPPAPRAGASSSQSSPLRLGSSSDAPDEWDEMLSEGDRSVVSTYSSSSPFRLPLVTPAPALALTRFRNERTQRRIEKLARKQMEELEREELEKEELEREEKEARRAEQKANREKERTGRKVGGGTDDAEEDQLDEDQGGQEHSGSDREQEGSGEGSERDDEGEGEEEGDQEISWEDYYRPLRSFFEDVEV